jgi:hypothetical protein
MVRFVNFRATDI